MVLIALGLGFQGLGFSLIKSSKQELSSGVVADRCRAGDYLVTRLPEKKAGAGKESRVAGNGVL